MPEEIIKIISSYWPGSIAGIVSILTLLLFRSKLITMFTSSEVERYLYSKEKKWIISIIIMLGQSFLISLLMVLIYLYTITSKFENNYINIIVNCMMILGAISILFSTMLFKKSWATGLTKENKNIFFAAFLILSSFPLLSLSLAITTNDKSINDNIGIDNKSIILITVFILFFIASIGYSMVFKLIIESLSVIFLDKKKKKLYILEDNSSKWYIFHSIDKNNFFLGDNHIQAKCDKHKFIDKEELMKKEIHVYQY